MSNTTSATQLSGLRVAYISSESYVKVCDQLPRVTGRASIVHSLIESYGLLQHMSVVAPKTATEKDLRLFHSSEYAECLRTANLAASDEDVTTMERLEEFGLAYDCPVVDDMYNLVCSIAGGSLTAADVINRGDADVAINWGGGWHHAKRDEAAGFCYVNDAVLSLLRLREKFSRIVYVDLDLHHGDGVEDAFSATSKVLTVSFHKLSPGFFPGTGSLNDVGIGKGKHYAINVPLKDGIDDATFTSIFARVMTEVNSRYMPQVLVCQCGADGISGDPHASFNLTPKAFISCLQQLLSFKIPMVLLGGGGYCFTNTARCWAQMTATAVGVSPLPSDIPEHRHFIKYGPDFDLDISPTYIRNMNTKQYVEDLMSTVVGNGDTFLFYLVCKLRSDPD